MDMGPGSKPADTPQRQHGGHLQTFKSTSSGEYTKQVDADEDESDSQGTRNGMFSEGSRTGGIGNSLLNGTTKREFSPRTEIQDVIKEWGCI